MKRRVLVILSNRLERLKPPRYVEVECDSKGTILGEKRLRSAPRKGAYEEVWENDEGKPTMDLCTRMKRHYKHPLLKRKPA